MLVVDNISKTFFPGTINEKRALQGLSLHLKPGDFATVIGGNGAGKSTMLKQLTGISYNLETELEELAACIEKRCALLASEERRKSLEEEFRRNCFTLNAERR